jgi:hypothetical protein
MLPDTHPLVVKELKLKTAAGSKAWDSSTIDIHRRQWALQGKRWGDASMLPPKEEMESPWYASLNARQRDVLAYNQLFAKKDEGRLVGVDVSQSIGRAPNTQFTQSKAPKVVVPTILPNTLSVVHCSAPASECLVLRAWLSRIASDREMALD